MCYLHIQFIIYSFYIMKKNLFVLAAAILFAAVINAAPAFNAPTSVDVIQGSGENFFVLTGVSDLTAFDAVTVTTGTALLDGVPTIEYNQGQTFAIVKFTEKGAKGAVLLTLTSGAASKNVLLNIAPLSNPGMSLDIYDAAFWQTPNTVSGGTTPSYSDFVPNAAFPAENDAYWKGKWEDIIKLLTNTDCEPTPTETACNPYPIPDLGTSSLKGYFIPPTSGSYTFSVAINRDGGALYFDKTATSWKAATKIADQDNATAAAITLEAGKAYPIYVVRWYIHRHDYNIQVEGPNIAKQIIPGSMLTPVYDVVKPDAPLNTTINMILTNSLQISWKKPDDSKKTSKIKGYNLYINGVKSNKSLLTGLSFLAEGLTADKEHVVFVTAVDALGNESFPSAYATATTSKESLVAPTPPTHIREYGVTGSTIKLRWAGAKAAVGFEVVAYDVYVNDVKYNNDYIYADTAFIRGLQAETDYTIEVVSYNSTLVASKKSKPATFTTSAFDPNDSRGLEYGEYRARLNIEKKNISWTEGVGINADIKEKTLFANNGNNDLNKGLRKLKPGSLRWGGIDANEYGFNGVTGDVDNAGQRAKTIGKARKDAGNATHAMNMNFCNEIGAYYSLCTGMKETPYKVDYVDANDTQIFLNLIEYLAGPSTTVYGAIRASEGFTEPLLKKGLGKGLILELGNEVWGSSGHHSPMGSNYGNYGKWCRKIATAIKTSPYYNDIKDMVYIVYSGRNPHPADSYLINEQMVAGHKGEVNTFGPGGYLGGNLNYNPEVAYGETVGEYYRLRHAQIKYNLEGLILSKKEQMKDGQDPLYVYFYETQASVSDYFGNLGQGIVLNDYLTSSMKYGSIVPAIFHYDGGEWRITTSDGTPFAHHIIARFINEHCKGHLVSSYVESNNYLTEKGGKPLLNYDPVGTSVYNNGKKWSILLFSRDFDNDYTVQLNLPNDIGTISNVKKYWVTGDGSENGPSIRTEFVTDSLVSNVEFKDNVLVTVPKYSMVLYTFEANDPGFTKLPLGYFEFAKAAETLVAPVPLEIKTNKGSASFNPAIEPHSSYTQAKADEITWEVNADDNPHIADGGVNMVTITPAVTSTKPYPDYYAGYQPVMVSSVRVTAKGTCNGVVYIRGFLPAKPTEYVVVKVTISGQTGDCNEGDKAEPEIPFTDEELADIIANSPRPGEISTEDVIPATEAWVYPNPAKEVLFVKTSGGDAMATITVYNSSGVRVMAETGNSELFELNISTLQPGYYLVSIEKDGKTETVAVSKK